MIRAQPSLYDGYIQAAAAYEAMGEKEKAAARLAEYARARGSHAAPRCGGELERFAALANFSCG